jgi:hypothetical protein
MELEVSPLLDLYDAVLNTKDIILNLDDLKQNPKMEAIDLFLKARARLQNQNINLFRAISNYVTSPTDVDRHANIICFLANFTLGPVVLYVNDLVGYGLFAEKDYSDNEIVAEYGGVVADEELIGPYVITVRKHDLDGYFGFKLSQKGRFINEDHSKSTFKTNSAMQKHLKNAASVLEEFTGQASVVFRTRKSWKYRLEKGQEILWYYGPNYSRPYLSLQCAVCKSKAEMACGKCLSTMYCGNSCANQDWYMHFKNECSFIL